MSHLVLIKYWQPGGIEMTRRSSSRCSWSEYSNN